MPERLIHYADGDFDRAAEYRQDAAWLAARLVAPTTRVTLLHQGKHLLNADGAAPVFLSGPDLAGMDLQDTAILLGLHDDVAYFAIELTADDALLRDGYQLLGLRDFLDGLEHRPGAILAYARALTHWHAGHRFCGACGQPTVSERAGHMRRCTDQDCRRMHFPRTDPAVITLVIDNDRCLLARRRIWPENRRSTIAGFVEPGETLEHAVAREILEEVGLQVSNVRYRGSQPWPFPASLMLGFWARAESTDIRVDGDEISEADWYTAAQVDEAVADGTLILPPSDSISHRLVTDWLATQ